jgi:hypothetical protein
MDFFSPDYATARRRFRQAAQDAGWTREAHAVGGAGPDGTALTIEAAFTEPQPAGKVLVVSSGLHGVEGFFGSAVQLALLARWREQQREPAAQCLFLHALNPFGFAWLRRVNEHNVDLNRNFLLPGQAFSGSPPGYAALDPLLNPRSPPAPWEPFRLKALWAVARTGMPRVKVAIATGQYDFSQGLFFGGAGPEATQEVLRQHLPRWLAGANDVVHLDLHAGLGRRGACKLIVDHALSDDQRARLARWFGPASFEGAEAREVGYASRGSLGPWLVSQRLAGRYLQAFAEYGTHGAVAVVSGLRAENRAHHWGEPAAISTHAAKQRLKELFCPADPAWCAQVTGHAVQLAQSALHGLLED